MFRVNYCNIQCDCFSENGSAKSEQWRQARLMQQILLWWLHLLISLLKWLVKVQSSACTQLHVGWWFDGAAIRQLDLQLVIARSQIWLGNFLSYFSFTDVWWVKFLKFADDTKIYHTVYSDEDVTALHSDLTNLVEWSKEWQMLSNADKCKVMHVGYDSLIRKPSMIWTT